MLRRLALLAAVSLFACGPEEPGQTAPLAGIYAVSVTVLADTCEPRSCDARRNGALTVAEDGRMIADISHHFGELWSAERIPFDPDPDAGEFRYLPFDFDYEPECGERRWLLEIEEAAEDALTVRETERFTAECSAPHGVSCTRVTLHEFTLQTACELGVDCPAYAPDVAPGCE